MGDLKRSPRVLVALNAFVWVFIPFLPLFWGGYVVLCMVGRGAHRLEALGFFAVSKISQSQGLFTVFFQADTNALCEAQGLAL